MLGQILFLIYILTDKRTGLEVVKPWLAIHFNITEICCLPVNKVLIHRKPQRQEVAFQRTCGRSATTTTTLKYIEDITRRREDMNFIFEHHEKIQFISSSRRVIFFLLDRQYFLHKQQCKSGK